MGEPHGCLGNASWRIPHLAQSDLPAFERRERVSRLEFAVGWVSLFVGMGVAIHSTYWHNNYGEPSSRGCVNANPDDAKWVFRWNQLEVMYDPGDVTVEMPGGTKVSVEKMEF